jgi:hypothetical protein
MCDKTNTDGFWSWFGGSQPIKTSGEEFFEQTRQKIDDKTPKAPFMQGFLNTFIKRKLAVYRLMSGDLPSPQLIKKGVKFAGDVTEYVETDGPSHIKEDSLSVVKDVAVEKLSSLDIPDIVEGTKKVYKATSIATTTTPEMIETMTNDTMTMVKQTGKQMATTVGGGVAIGLVFKQASRLPVPFSMKMLLLGSGMLWSGTGLLSSAYGLNDLGKNTEDANVGLFMRVMEENSKRKSGGSSSSSFEPPSYK